MDDDKLISDHARQVLLGDRQCTATNRSGERCGRASIVGGFVCNQHGGDAPQTREAAKKRILAMAIRGLDDYEVIRETWYATKCPTCKRPTGDPWPIITVNKELTKNAGLAESTKIELTTPSNSFANLSDDEMTEKLELMQEKIADQLRMLRLRQQRDDEQPVLEGDTAVFVLDDAPEAEEPND